VKRARALPELPEHVLSGDFAPGIAASRRANPEKKGICAPRKTKNRLRKRAHVLFSAPILNKRQHCAAFRNH
jgi:hypothetical protein